MFSQNRRVEIDYVRAKHIGLKSFHGFIMMKSNFFFYVFFFLYNFLWSLRTAILCSLFFFVFFFINSYSLCLGRMRIMLLLPFPRNAWQFGRPEKQGASAYIKRIFRTENVHQNVFIANKFCLPSGLLSLSLDCSSM